MLTRDARAWWQGNGDTSMVELLVTLGAKLDAPSRLGTPLVRPPSPASQALVMHCAIGTHRHAAGARGAAGGVTHYSILGTLEI